MDTSWLAQEAQTLHSIFQNAFFAMLVAFLVAAVVMEFFKIPLGSSPAFTTLVGRALIATLLLVALPEFMNIVADTTDSIAREIGNLNNIGLVMGRLGEKLKTLSFSWTSIRDVVTILISFLSFFALYITVYFADAAFAYCWVLIYVFSPLVLALYVFPQTAGATGALFRSILEVSLWKICWAVMAALLWSTALSDINKPDSHINWLTSIVLNLMLMISVLLTPKLVKTLLSGGLGELASGAHGAVMEAASQTPTKALAHAKSRLLYVPTRVGSYAKTVASNAVRKSGSQRNAARVPESKRSSIPQVKPQQKKADPTNRKPPVRYWS